MNGRILQLLQQPQQILLEDLQLLSREIQQNPYAQSLRALRLLGTSKFAPEDYQNELSMAAAYTTDKKVLYHLVHGRKFQEKVDSGEVMTQNSGEVLAENLADFQPQPSSEPLEEKPETAVSEIPPESIFQHKEILENQNVIVENNSLIFSEIEEEKSENPQVAVALNENSENEPKTTAEVNFYQTEEMPSAVVPASESSEKFVPPMENSTDKVEQARLDLIAEVERKMAEKRQKSEGNLSEKTLEKVEENDHRINFSSEYVHHVADEDTNTEATPFVLNSPKNLSQEEISVQGADFVSKDLTEEETEQDFGFENPPAQTAKDTPPELEERPGTAADSESNVPGFFSTWMSWLNLDKAAPQPKPQPPKIDSEKLDVIDKFIAAEPKITPVRGEDSSGKSNDKKDNIMHLMTDTLANLYVEQRLYGKALQAYDHLSQKHPEKQEYYAEKMAKIQEMRTPGGS